MATSPTQTAQDTLKSQSSLSYAGYNVTPDWNYFRWSSPEGRQMFTYFNPTDASKNFTLDYRDSSGDYEQLSRYLTNPDVGVNGALSAGLFQQNPIYGQVKGTSIQQYLPTTSLYGYSLNPDDPQNSFGNLKTLSQLGQTGPTLYQNTLNTARSNYVPPQPAPPPQSAAQQTAGTYLSKPSTGAPSSLTMDQATAAQQGLSRDQIANIANSITGQRPLSSQELSDINQVVKTPISINPSTQVPSTQLTQTPRTAYDVQSLLARNDALMQQKIAALQPSKEELAAQTAYANAKTRVLALEAQAGGQYNPNNESIPLTALVGQAQSQMFSAQLGEENALSKLTLFQKDREILNQALQDQIQNGQFSIQIAMELDKTKKEEEKAAKDFAVEYGITAPYYKVGQAVYKTGGGWVSEQQFFADNPQFQNNWANVPAGFIQSVDGLTVAQKADLNLRQQQLDTAKYQLTYNPITGEGQIFDPKTGQTSTPGFQTSPSGGFRTDRNNNPTAMTTDVAKSMGLVESVDYVQGDKFPGNSNLYTARLLGDPIETTIKGIDKGGFFTASGKPRWSYFSMPQQQWQSLSHDQKVAVITQMYKTEGGSGMLVNNSGAAPVDALVNQIKEDPSRFTNLTDAQKKAVTARMAQLGLPIPNASDTSKSQTGPEATKIRENAASGLRALSTVESELNRNPSIVFLSKLPFSPGARTYTAAVNEMKDVLTRLRTGAALNESEQGFYARQLPGVFDSPDTVKYKLSIFRDLFNRLSNGDSPSPTQSSSNNDPLGLFP